MTVSEHDMFAGLEMWLFETQGGFRSWLERHANRPCGVWLKFARRGSGRVSLTYGEALDAALCFGWIDGHRKELDADVFIQRFTPRRRGSNWSKVNVGKAEALIRSGRMQARGYAEVEAAKADGRWRRATEVPSPSADFLEALGENPAAGDFYAGLTAAQCEAFLRHIDAARKPETRRRRIEKAVDLLSSHRKLHDQSRLRR